MLLLLIGLLPLAIPAHADIGATHTSVVDDFASFNTPGVVDGSVFAIAVEGDTVFVGGSFTQVQEPLRGETFNQPYLFAYSKSTGNIIRSFDPILNDAVLALETTGDGTGVFAGGLFNRLNDEFNQRNLVKIDDNGDRVTSFSAKANISVTTMVRQGNTLYVGGEFTEMDRIPVEHLAALDTTTGALSPNLNLDFDGVIDFSPARPGVSGVEDIDITSDGRLLAVAGNFSTINGIERSRLALIELDGEARVSDWNTDVYVDLCPNPIPQYIRGIDIAPDNSYLLVGTNAGRIIDNPACDTIVRLELDDLTNTNVQPSWVNYTGGDSVYEVVSTDHVVYTGGHFRWLNNDTTIVGDTLGPGSVPRVGLAALDPKNGLTLLDWVANRNPRGVGVFSMIAEPEGLYVGDDTDFLNGNRHAKLKFFPITANTIERPGVQSLPATLITPDGDNMGAVTFNGANFGSTTQLLDGGWSDARGGVFLFDLLFHADDDGVMWMSEYNGDTFESRTTVDMLGQTENEWALSQLGGMYFDPEWGRLYYTLQGDSQLYWRGFTPAGPHFGNDTYVAEQQGDIAWGDVSGMDVIDGNLYFARNDGNLYRAELDGYEPVSGTTEAISGPTIDGRNWANNLLAFTTVELPDEPVDPVDPADFEFSSSGSEDNGRFQTFSFDVAEGDLVEAVVNWDDPDAEVRVFLRDETTTQVDRDTDGESTGMVSAQAQASGRWSVAVSVVSGNNVNYDVLVDTTPGDIEPEPQADFEFSSSGASDNGRFQTFKFEVAAGELVEAQVNWDDTDADVRVFLRDETNNQIARDTAGFGSAALSAIAETSGTWSIAVLVFDGATNYDILVDTSNDFVPPEPQADFEFSSSGSPDAGRFQTFEIDVAAGDLVEVETIWSDPTADVRVFLRDENKNLITRDIEGEGSSMLSAIAETSGAWTVAVLVFDGNVEYDVLVDTTSGFEPPEPRADFEFASSASPDDGRFQTFNFDVTAGELVEVLVNWDDPTADVRVFLRDETRSQITRNTDGSGSATMSAVAATSGQWSVAVQVTSGSVDYEVLVDTTDAPVAPVAITAQPATFAVTASGSGTLQYQWRANGSAIAGETTNTLTLSSVSLDDSGTLYSVRVTDDNGSITSDNATLTVEEIPVELEITTQPMGTLQYQWRANGSAIAGETTNTLTLSSVSLDDSGVAYSVRVTDDNGSVTSNNATLTVEEQPIVITNLALQGTASQSSTDFSGVASRAIDGDTNGRYNDGSVTHTKYSFRPWWEVKLPQNSRIDEITLFNRTDCCTGRLDEYIVYVLDENRRVVFGRIYRDTPNPSKVIDIGGLTGRTIRIQLYNSGILSLAEVQVMGVAQ